MIFDAQNVSYLLGVAGLIGVVFTIYNSYKKPQIASDQETIRLRADLNDLRTEVVEIKEKHLTSVEGNIKDLSQSVHGLALNVTRLTTIIDERIPKMVK